MYLHENIWAEGKRKPVSKDVFVLFTSKKVCWPN